MWLCRSIILNESCDATSDGASGLSTEMIVIIVLSVVLKIALIIGIIVLIVRLLQNKSRTETDGPEAQQLRQQQPQDDAENKQVET